MKIIQYKVNREEENHCSAVLNVDLCAILERIGETLLLHSDAYLVIIIGQLSMGETFDGRLQRLNRLNTEDHLCREA